MTREKLKRHKANKKELEAVVKEINKLQEKLKYVEEEYIVSGKVKKSSKDFPYIEEHMTVMVPDSKRTEPIRADIRKEELWKVKLEAEIQEVERFIDSLPDGLDKRIFKMVYLDGLSQQKAGEAIGYTQARVSQIIRKCVKDL